MEIKGVRWAVCEVCEMYEVDEVYEECVKYAV